MKWAVSMLVSLVQMRQSRFVSNQRFCNFQMSALARIMKRSIVSSILRRNASSTVDEQLDHLFVSVSGRPMQWREPVVVNLINVVFCVVQPEFYAHDAVALL